MEKFQKFYKNLSQTLDGFNIKFKDESTLMKIIGYILFFNKAFMNDYVTTIGKTVYFPSKKKLKKTREYGSMITLAHEYQHAKDGGFLFSILYLFPQILSFLGVLLLLSSPVWITLMATGILFWSWWLLPFLLTLLFLAPIPAPWRKHYELRGNYAGIFTHNELLKHKNINKSTRLDILKSKIRYTNKKYTGPDYYFMWPFGVEEKLDKKVDNIVAERNIFENETFLEILKALKDIK